MNDARFAVLQRSLDVPEVEKLKRAFRAVKCLTPADAHTVARDAFGILVKNLEIADAMALQLALQGEGIDTAVVMQTDLADLPPVKFVRRMDCQAGALVIFDPIGREVLVPWGHVGLIAAGEVWTSVFQPQKEALPQAQRDFTVADFLDGLAGRKDDLATASREHLGSRDWPSDAGIRERQVGLLLLEIVLTGATMRFQVEADKFLFNYLGDRKRATAKANFTLLVRDLMSLAPNALVNHGAFHLREEPPALFEYPSKNAFHEEMIWILWRASDAQAS